MPFRFFFRYPESVWFLISCGITPNSFASILSLNASSVFTVSRRMEMAQTPPTETIRQIIRIIAALELGMELDGPCGMEGILITSITAFSKMTSEICG